jgi:hypothetical protein
VLNTEFNRVNFGILMHQKQENRAKNTPEVACFQSFDDEP